MSSRTFRILTIVLAIALLLVPAAALAFDWSPHTQLGPPSLPDYPEWPAAAAGADGTLSVVWMRYPVQSLWFAHFNGESWVTPHQINWFSWNFFPDVAVGPDGTSHVVWMSNWPSYCNPIRQGVHYGRLDSLSPTSHLTGIECTGLRTISRPTIALAPSGEVFVAALDNTDVKFVHREAAVWSTPEIVGQSGCNPYLSVDPSGLLYITYCSLEHGGQIVYRERTGGVWGPPTVFDYLFSAAFPRVEMFHHENGTSDILALGEPIQHWHFDGESWLGPTAVASGTKPGYGDASMGPDGLLAVIWPTGAPSEVMVRIWDGEAWLPSENVSDSAGTALHSTVGITSESKSIAAWSETEGADYSMLARVAQLKINEPPTAEAGGPYSVYEGGSVELAASGTDPEGGSLSYAWDLDNDEVFETPGQSVTFDAALLDGPSEVQVAVKATDGGGLDAVAHTVVAVSNVAPAVGTIMLPGEPISTGSDLHVTADFADPGVLDTHTAVWDWGDGTTSDATIAEANGSGSAAGAHAYASSGLYTITLTVTDDDSGTGTATYEYAVVYDPNGGFVTGGGWIDSPAGAYLADPSLSGRANFSVNAKYKKGAQTPTGTTEFQFQAGDLNFHSDSYEWLVVAGGKAIYMGSGTINGDGSYRFMLSAIDGDLADGDKVDRFRIQIWVAASGELVYDNQLDAPDDADPSTALGGGSIVIHKER